MSKWSDIYRQEIVRSGSMQNYILGKVEYKKRLISIIRKYVKNGGTILETGCGSGASLAYLQSLGYVVSGIDSDLDMIKISQEVTAISNEKIDLRNCDLLNIPDDMGKFDLSFSNGVLEHFSDDKIVEIIKYSLSKAEVLIISVPTDYFKNKDKIYGDERFLSVSYWEKIIEKSDVQYLEKFAFCFKNKFIELAYIMMGRIFHIKPPFIGFVLKNKNID